MTESQDTGPRTENQQSRPGPQLNVTKVVASAAGAMLAAVVLSKFGVAGTITGAALGSVVSTLGTDLNQHYLSKSSQRLQELRASQRRARLGAAADAAAGKEPKEEEPKEEEPKERQMPSWLSWQTLAVLGVGGFLVAMLAITGFELAVGKPLAGLFGHEVGDSRTTTFGEVTSGGGSGGQERSEQPATSVDTESTTEGTEPGSTVSTATTLPGTSTTVPSGQQAPTTTAGRSATTRQPSSP